MYLKFLLLTDYVIEAPLSEHFDPSYLVSRERGPPWFDYWTMALQIHVRAYVWVYHASLKVEKPMVVAWLWLREWRCSHDGRVYLRCVDVIWFVFHVLQLLLIRFAQQNMCCIRKSTTRYHQKSDFS